MKSGFALRMDGGTPFNEVPFFILATFLKRSSFLTHSSLIIFTAIVMYIGFNKCISCMLASTKVN